MLCIDQFKPPKGGIDAAPLMHASQASTEGVVRQPAGKPKGNGAVYAAIDAGLIDQVLSRPESFHLQETTYQDSYDISTARVL